jgi:hypothetical protein
MGRLCQSRTVNFAQSQKEKVVSVGDPSLAKAFLALNGINPKAGPWLRNGRKSGSVAPGTFMLG